tara:strand:- start:491 stop:1114 length:624 start_codon:yes stop_codon:yes gene_type:complete
MLISKELWKSNSKLAMECLNTKFVQGIKKGNLPRNIFKEYLAQDYFFLESFAKAYGLAVSKSIDKNAINSLSKLLVGVSEELILHETYAKEWEIDLSINYINPATKKYTDFLEDVSKKLSAVEIMFAMTPCMRLYSWIGNNLSEMIENNPYKEWILTYSDKGFDDLAKSLEKIIDNYQKSYDIKKANNLYKRAMELELEFFNAYSNF